MDEFDFVDADGDMETEVDGRVSKKKDMLEEGKLKLYSFVSILNLRWIV